MRNILVIPSWYPTPENALKGTFFEEQLRFLFSQGLDIRVLFVEQKVFPARPFLCKSVLPKTVSFKEIGSKVDPPTWYRKQYIPRILFGRMKFNMLCSSYKQGWKHVVKDGWNPDLILGLAVVDGGLVAQYLGQVFNVPYTVLEHNSTFLDRLSKYKRKSIISAYNQANAVGVVSRSLARHLASNGVSAPMTVVWNLIDESKFELKETLPDVPFHIVTISYPHYLKDLDTFFKAIAYIRERTKAHVSVSVVGSDRLESSRQATTHKIRSVADKHGVQEYCQFIAYLTREEMRQFLPSAHVFISSSITETFGVAMREAMMCGVPVVSTRNGGAEDTIDGENSFLVPTGDYVGIGEKVLALIRGDLSIDRERLRQHVVEQSGRVAFLKAMQAFLKLPYNPEAS